MHLLRLTRTALFRLSLMYAGLFSLSVAGLFVILYVLVVGQVQAHLRVSIKDETASILEETSTAKLDAIVQERASVEMRLFEYALTNGNKVTVSSLANAWPWHAGWQIVSPAPSNEDEAETDNLLAWGQELPGNQLLVVAESEHSVEEIKDIIWQAFVWGGVFTLLLSLAGGLVMSAGFLRRIDTFNTTAAHIMEGKMGQRIPTQGTRDVFDQLAQNLNRMLARVEDVMEGMRQVSNDIAHDLRSPLTRLRQNLEKASLKAHTLEEYQSAVEKALAATDEVLETFKALLRISQIEAGTDGVELERTNLSKLCHKAAEIYQPIAEDKNHTLTSLIAEELYVTADPALLMQLMANLLENAINHTPTGCNIALTLIAEETGIVLSVADKGQGIPPTDHEKVLRRFVRLNDSRNTPGNGLGLALVSAVVTRHKLGLKLLDNQPGLRVEVFFPHPPLTPGL